MSKHSFDEMDEMNKEDQEGDTKRRKKTESDHHDKSPLEEGAVDECFHSREHDENGNVRYDENGNVRYEDPISGSPLEEGAVTLNGKDKMCYTVRNIHRMREAARKYGYELKNPYTKDPFDPTKFVIKTQTGGYKVPDQSDEYAYTLTTMPAEEAATEYNYEGQRENGKKHGRGKYTFTNGNV